MQSLFGKFNNGLTKVEDWLAAAGGGIVCFMMVFTVAGVIGRVAKHPVKGEVETVTLIFVYVVMFSISFALRKGEHLAVGVVFDRLKPRAQRIMIYITVLIGLFIVFMLVWSMASNVIWAKTANDTLVGSMVLPTWWARLAMPIGIAPAFFRLMVIFVQVARGEG